MNTDPMIRSVLDDLEEIYGAEGLLPLYQVAWTVTGWLSRDDPRFGDTCSVVFDSFRGRHPDLHLVWVPWPIDVTQARAAETGTDIDLDLDPEASVDTPLLALMDPSDLPA